MGRCDASLNTLSLSSPLRMRWTRVQLWLAVCGAGVTPPNTVGVSRSMHNGVVFIQGADITAIAATRVKGE